MPTYEVLAADEEVTENVRFGRNRLLAAAGGVLFGTLAGYFGKTQLAWGLCGDVSPCHGFKKCCCCSGTRCCQAGCRRPNVVTCGSVWNDWCWNVCTPNNVRITCCDWINGNDLYCICRENTGSC